ncbi:hypothetical protein [Actinomyces vulturis]|uniref:hypothetical protein n=1 Tax=Actinomyces vulturis TaxID=1857645 RepID=UPI00159EE7BF|nr:hypothetical protein [Actinomyces vulturis]
MFIYSLTWAFMLIGAYCFSRTFASKRLSTALAVIVSPGLSVALGMTLGWFGYFLAGVR